MSAIEFPWPKEQCQECEEPLDVSSRQQDEVVVENEDFLWAFRSRVGGGRAEYWSGVGPRPAVKGSMGDCVEVEQWQKVG